MHAKWRGTEQRHVLIDLGRNFPHADHVVSMPFLDYSTAPQMRRGQSSCQYHRDGSLLESESG